MSSPPSPSSANRTFDHDPEDTNNPYGLQDFHDPYNRSLSDVRPIADSITGDHTHDAPTQLPSIQGLTRPQETSDVHSDSATEHNPYREPVSIGSIQTPRPTSDPTAEGVYDGYELPGSRSDIRPAGSSVPGTAADDQNAAPRPIGMSVTSKSIKKMAPPSYYMQDQYK